MTERFRVAWARPGRSRTESRVPGRPPGLYSGMARELDAIPDNVNGEFFVDSSCIDCDLCRQLAPAVFARSGRGAIVRGLPARARRRPSRADGAGGLSDQLDRHAHQARPPRRGPEQLASIAKLAAYRFTHVLPGHGRRFAAPDADAMREVIEVLARDLDPQ